MKNTGGVFKSRLDETEDQITKLENKVRKKKSQTDQEHKTKNRLKRNKEGLRELQDNKKSNSIHTTGLSEGEEEE